MTVYLSLDQVLRIHAGLVEGAVVRELNRIDAAVQRPQAGWGEYEEYPSLPAKAAALLHGLASTQGFEDGNKRTAWLAMLAFLAANDLDLAEVPVIEAEAFAMAVAVGAWSADTVAKATEWIAHRLDIGPLQRPNPQLDWAMLARGAIAEDGSLHVIGGSLATLAPSELPYVTAISVACRIFWTPGDQGREHPVTAEVVRDRDQEVISGAGWNCVPPVRGGHTHHPYGLMPQLLALELPLLLEEQGQHWVQLLLDDAPLARLSLNVVVIGQVN